MDYARHARRLARPQKDGHSYREHLEQAAKIAGTVGKVARAELAGPDFPEVLGYLWFWFCELLSARKYSESGPQPIGYADIKAWSELTHRSPTGWEVAMLRDLDSLWLEKS